jgi:hypothetical protein
VEGERGEGRRRRRRMITGGHVQELSGGFFQHLFRSTLMMKKKGRVGTDRGCHINRQFIRLSIVRGGLFCDM